MLACEKRESVLILKYKLDTVDFAERNNEKAAVLVKAGSRIKAGSH